MKSSHCLNFMQIKYKNISRYTVYLYIVLYTLFRKEVWILLCEDLSSYLYHILQQDMKSEMWEFPKNKFSLKGPCIPYYSNLINLTWKNLQINPFLQKHIKDSNGMAITVSEYLHFAPSSGIWWQEVKSSSIHLHPHLDVPLCTSPKWRQNKSESQS